MTISVRTTLRNWREQPANIREAIKDGLHEGMDIWLDRQKGRQMSGRPGLRAPTGTLRRSWQTRVKTGGFKGHRVAAFTTVKYAAPHEFGKMVVPTHTRGPYRRKSGAEVRKHSVRGFTRSMPVRLHMREAFKREASSIILAAMRKRLRYAMERKSS